MADVVEMIQLSPTMDEGLIVAWLKREGDVVAAGDVIAEIETDKATMEMESFFDGTLLSIVVPAGSAAKIGAALAVIGAPGEDVAAALAARGGAPAAAVAEPAAAAVASDVGAAESSAAPEATVGASDGGRVRSSPLARKLAAERGIAIESVVGTGPAGRVVKRDVDAFVAPAKGAASSAAPAAAASRPAASVAAVSVAPSAAPAASRSVPLTPMRKAIAKNLTAAWQAPAFMLTREIAMERAMAFRRELNAALEADGDATRISVNDLIIKACARALVDVPAMNSAYEGDTITLFGSADVGMAVALDGGLITPVIRAAESKSLRAIATEARALAGRARDKKLAPEEYTGSTFSISNLGMFGIDHFTAVLNPPAAGILAVGQTRKVPVVGPGDVLVVGERMTVTLTCDHRAVDGAVGATFLQRFARYMESPALMLA
ncbi:MAG: 2-oxo acid dehydrogenase subunit E2 [Myxococcales bacterium]|nr:2-oxo acid dehydrogenase subunit E2 [Myxococcales bacterium]